MREFSIKLQKTASHNLPAAVYTDATVLLSIGRVPEGDDACNQYPNHPHHIDVQLCAGKERRKHLRFIDKDIELSIHLITALYRYSK